jgi:CBS domain-containing protein
MTSPVVSLQSDHSVHFASGLMQRAHIRHLPVVDDGQLVGLVTHRDLMAAQSSVLARRFDPRGEGALSLCVADIMKTGVWSVERRTPVLEAARIMSDHKLGCLPVLDAEQLVGIVTAADFLQLLVRALEWRREREDTGRFFIGVQGGS